TKITKISLIKYVGGFIGGEFKAKTPSVIRVISNVRRLKKLKSKIYLAINTKHRTDKLAIKNGINNVFTLFIYNSDFLKEIFRNKYPQIIESINVNTVGSCKTNKYPTD